MALLRLQDSPVLEPLARAARNLNVEAVLFGSVASRALLFDAAGARAKNLFELAEHTSDIDIGHTGPPSLTPKFAEAIASLMPLAPWFRWSIVDQGGLAALDNIASFNVGIPVRRLQLGTKRLPDPDQTSELLRRALEGELDLVPNPRFDGSPRSQFDSEATAVLVYVDAAIDVLQAYLRRPRLRRFGGPGQRNPAADLVEKGIRRLEQMDDIQRSMAARRLWYRLAGSAVRVSQSVFQRAIEFFGLQPIIKFLDRSGYPATTLAEGKGIPIISAYLGEGHYRMPTVVFNEDETRDWNSSLGSILEDISRSQHSADKEDPIVLAPGNDVIGGLTGIPVKKGVSPSSQPLGSSNQEFFHISLPLRVGLPRLNSTNMTAVVVGHREDGPVLLPAFASVSTAMPWPFHHRADDPFDSRRCTIRTSLSELADPISKIDVFLIRGVAE